MNRSKVLVPAIIWLLYRTMLPSATKLVTSLLGPVHTSTLNLIALGVAVLALPLIYGVWTRKPWVKYLLLALLMGKFLISGVEYLLKFTVEGILSIGIATADQAAYEELKKAVITGLPPVWPLRRPGL